MNDCDLIQPELSAYVDGEMGSSERQLIEAHLASCPRCQKALGELRTLADGVSALPKLEPSPQFLAQVRRKISRGYDPEAPTWIDYLFRPFWVKVPIEIAAIAAVALVLVQLRQAPLGQPAPGEQMAQAENGVSEQQAPMEVKPESVQPTTLPEQQPAAPAEAPQVAIADAPSAPAVGGESIPLSEAQSRHEMAAASAADVATASGPFATRESGSTSQPDGAPIGQSVKARLEGQRRVPTLGLAGAASASPSMPSPTVASALARKAGVEPSRLGDVVVVRSGDLHAVQNRAEELAARCNGKVITVPSSMDSTGQLFFVEVPREYAASFKLDMQQPAGTSTSSVGGALARIDAAPTNIALLSATSTGRVFGVLTGGADTGSVFSGLAQLNLPNNPQSAAAATTVLQIYVMPPALASTNGAPTALSN